MQKKHDLDFPILQDTGNTYAAAMGLRFTLPDYLQEIYSSLSLDLPRFNGDESWTLAMPARYVVAPDNSIVAADFDPDYTLRPEPQKTLADLRTIGSGG